MGQPWNNWYHVNGNTYGTWLRGSALGFRSRHHRDHVEGDYKHPPPRGKYDVLKRQSKLLMTRAPVYLSPAASRLALLTMLRSFIDDGIEIICIAVDSHHYHILARFPDHNPRLWVGRAKGRSSRELSRLGLVVAGGAWADRNRCLPIKDRSHQVTAARYIAAHAWKGANVWRIGMQVPDAGEAMAQKR